VQCAWRPQRHLGLAALTESFNLYSSEAKFFIAKRINVYDSCSSK